MDHTQEILLYMCIGSMTGTFIAYFISAMISLITLIKDKIEYYKRRKNGPLDLF